MKHSLKEQKQKQKQERLKYLSPEPLTYIVREIKHFDNLPNFNSYIEKNRPNFQHNEYHPFGEGNSICYRIPDNDFPGEVESIVLHITSDNDINELKISDSIVWEYDITTTFNILRKETPQQIKKRMELIAEWSILKTEQLLKYRRHSGPAGIYLDGWKRGVLHAILDTRPHVPNTLDRKRTRQEKAKYQRTK